MNSVFRNVLKQNTRAMRYAFAVVVLSGVTATVYCQDMRLAGIEYFNYPKVKLKDDASNNEASFQEFGAFINYPRQLKNKKTILMNGIQYGRVNTTLYNNVTSAENELVFHKISYSFTLIQRFNEKLTFVGRLTPTLASDFEDGLSGNDFVMQGSLMMLKRYSEKVLGGAGVFYTTRFGRPLVIPSVQYQYKNDRHAWNIFLPVFLNYGYKVDKKEKLGVGFRAAINGANFNVSATSFPSSTAMDNLNYARANIGPYINYQVTKLLLVEAFSGISTMRRYEFVDEGGRSHEYDSRTGAFFNIGIVLTPPRPAKKDSPSGNP